MKKPRWTSSEYEKMAWSCSEALFLLADDNDMTKAETAKLLRAMARVCREEAIERERPKKESP